MTHGTAWILLVICGLIDVAWAISMKYADGYTRIWWSLLSLALLASFVYLLARTMQVIPVGTAYAVGTGIGVVGTALAGIALFNEPVSLPRLACIGLVLVGIAGLRLAES